MPNPDPPTLPASEGDTPVDTSASATQSADSPLGEPKTETAPDTGELLRQAELKAQEHHDAWLRAKAEADNIRKRTQIELANAYKYAIESLAAELLPVKDSLEATLAADSAALETLKSGVELTLKQLSAVFEKANLKEPNTVINVLQKGYALHDRVVRPALVTIAGPKDAQA